MDVRFERKLVKWVFVCPEMIELGFSCLGRLHSKCIGGDVVLISFTVASLHYLGRMDVPWARVWIPPDPPGRGFKFAVK